MKLYFTFIASLFLLISCFWEKEIDRWYELSDGNLIMHYEKEDRSLNLENKDIRGFVNINLYLTWTEINNVYLKWNSIEWIDVSELYKLWRLDLSGNSIKYSNDLKLPKDIRHLDLSNNWLETIESLSWLKKIKTLDLSNNNLDDEDFKSLKWLEGLQYLNLEGNSISQKILDRLTEFNAKYLQTHEMPYVKKKAQ